MHMYVLMCAHAHTHKKEKIKAAAIKMVTVTQECLCTKSHAERSTCGKDSTLKVGLYHSQGNGVDTLSPIWTSTIRETWGSSLTFVTTLVTPKYAIPLTIIRDQLKV